MFQKLKYSFLCKTVAFILLVIFAFCTAFSLIGCGICFNKDFYIQSKEKISEEFYFETTYQIADVIRDGIYFYQDGSAHFNKNIIDFEKISSLSDFEIVDSNIDKVVFVSDAADFQGKYLQISELSYIGDLKIKVFLKPFAENTILQLKYNSLIWIFENRFSLLVSSVIFFVLTVIFFSFLIFAAGFKRKNESVAASFLEKIPFDIFTVFVFVSIALLVILTIELTNNLIIFLNNSLNYDPAFVFVFGISLLLFVMGSLFVIWSMSLAKRIRLKITLKSCLSIRFSKWLLRKIKSFIRFIINIIKNLPFVWKTVLIILAITLLELLVLLDGYIEYIVLFWVLEKAIFAPLAIFIAILLYKLKAGGEQISKGNLEQKIDTKYMFWDFKEHADNLNSIGNGISMAVEEKLKSERFKTELITNVSHDIKTPLTSVINYVDLIKKEEPKEEKIKEYIAVLEHQSNRLKKLVEDLVEASKASSGNLPVNLLPCNAQIALEQAVGEYSEKFKANNLQLIVKKEEAPISILVDGRYLWRIFDNLLNNICKYALPDSRVYLSLIKKDNIAEFCFKNISKYELDISAEELTERFVRSDKSRSTEGSGLGLSIAKSLTELQNGTFEIYSDGDLFKVVIKFNII